MFLNIFKIKKAIIAFVLIMLPLSSVGAAMQSANYIIYENVLHTFDGPIITAVSASVSVLDVTVTWDTNIIADGFVVYSTDSGFASSKEQGSSVKNSTSHSVLLSGLTANTTYYYKVKSTRVNGGVTESVASTFLTGSPAVVTPPAGGGGMVIIDKTDKLAPMIDNVAFVAASTSAVITWTTDEDSTSFVEYGETINYGSTFGSWNSVKEHKVVLENLYPATTYHFRALSSDGWGNVGYSEDKFFTTKTETGEEAKPGEKPKEEIDQKILEEVTRKTLEFLQKLFPEVSLNQLGQNPYASISSIDQILNFIPAPLMSGLPSMEIGANDATIKWTTDIAANSMVAYAPEKDYKPQASEPYIQIVGNPEVYSTDHEVKLIGLLPNTTYHLQLRSKAKLGPTAKSKDFTFTTRMEQLEITSYFSQIIDQQTAVFKWITNKPANSEVKIAPYLNNILAVDQSKTFKDDGLNVIHEIKIAEISGGTIYQVEISSTDEKNNTAIKVMDNFSTGKDDVVPEVTRIKAESTIFLDKKDKTQTVISWTTNEPATSRIYYQEGVHGGDNKLNDSTVLSDYFNKDHVIVITTFKPGTVYTFRVESKDASGNTTLSQPHTFMTAKQKESIIQVIMRVLENTFGWMKQIGN